MRSILLGIPVFLTACTAPWHRIVQYSETPATESPVVGVYRAIIADVSTPPASDTLILLDRSSRGGMSAIVVGAGRFSVPSHWEDSLKREVRSALADSAYGKEMDTSAFAQAARAAHVVLLPPDTTSWPYWSGHAPPARIRVTHPGFNSDSTIAILYVEYLCGPLCGNGSTLVLARRPGTAWKVFYGVTYWVS